MKQRRSAGRAKSRVARELLSDFQKRVYRAFALRGKALRQYLPSGR